MYGYPQDFKACVSSSSYVVCLPQSQPLRSFGITECRHLREINGVICVRLKLEITLKNNIISGKFMINKQAIIHIVFPQAIMDRNVKEKQS